MATEKQAPTQETVKMEDGRDVVFVGKKKIDKTVSIDQATNSVSVRMDFRNGKTLTWTVTPDLLLKCAGHGASQKLGDETAGEEDLDDAVLAVEGLIERLDKGEWAEKREGMSGTSILCRALMQLKSKPKEVIMAFLKDKTAAQKLALRNNEQLKPIIVALEAEKAQKGPKVDTDALLAQV